MKKLFYFASLVLLFASCSKDDDSAPAEISADRKFVKHIARPDGGDLSFTYDSSKRLETVSIGDAKKYTIYYEGNEVEKIVIEGSDTQGIYKFFNVSLDTGYAIYCYVYDYNSPDELSGVMAFRYYPEDNRFNDIMYMNGDGSIKKFVYSTGYRELTYDGLKKGAFANSNTEIIKYLMFVGRNDAFWPAYLGEYPCTAITFPMSHLTINNNYDRQGFIVTTSMDFLFDQIATYSYTEL